MGHNMSFDFWDNNWWLPKLYPLCAANLLRPGSASDFLTLVIIWRHSNSHFCDSATSSSVPLALGLHMFFSCMPSILIRFCVKSAPVTTWRASWHPGKEVVFVEMELSWNLLSQPAPSSPQKKEGCFFQIRIQNNIWSRMFKPCSSSLVVESGVLYGEAT